MTPSGWQLDLGAVPSPDGTSFRVWAPRAETVCVVDAAAPERSFPLHREGEYFNGILPDFRTGDRYRYLLDGTLLRPDPASRCQPEGVHGPSQVVDPTAFAWSDADWRGIDLADLITYELHVGTFTPAGTFTAVIEEIDSLVDLGITAIELMPVGQFPGSRNWGYDGVYPYAPQHSYGGHTGLKQLVDACHRKGMAVILDVVYNHLGPEGNYLHAFAPYFTDRYRTPWGDAVNFDGPYSDGVRHYIIANALHWLTEYHVDALRLDAVHGIFDFSPRHILREMADAVHELSRALGRPLHVIAESDLNDVRTITPADRGGHALDAQWADDFHHALRAFLTGERQGYYGDFGDFSQLVTAFREGFVYSGQYSPFRKRRHGSSTAAAPPRQLVVFAQNHDQVGNRPRGDRLGAVLTPDRLRLAAAAVLLSPYLPLIFMGEEYGEPAPFPYFVSHGDPALVEAVRRGRREEFAAFAWQGGVPDPQAEATFRSARLDRTLRDREPHCRLLAFYRELLRLRRELPPLRRPSRAGTGITAFGREQVLVMVRSADAETLVCLFNFSGREQSLPLPGPAGRYRKLVDSAAEPWGGSGSPAAGHTAAAALVLLAPFSAVVYRKE